MNTPRTLLRVLLFCCPLSVCAQDLQASYPLLTDLADATANYGDAALAGNPMPPGPPSDGVCHNGIYLFDPDGQNIETPNITSLDSTDLQIEVDFNLSALPGDFMPVIMGGRGSRWLGVYVDSSGNVGAKYNNSNLTYSSTTVSPGTWHTAQLRYEAGTLQIHLDATLIHQALTGPLDTGVFLNFTTNDFSNSRALNGCIRNLNIYNDTTLLTETFVFQLSGEQENPPVASPAIGGCMATVDMTASQTDISCAHNVADALAAHVHQAAAGVNGPIIVDLGDPTSPFQALGNLTPAQFDAMQRGETYVNVHSTANPSGEIRGQFLPRMVDDFPFPAAGSQEVPANASAARARCRADLNDEATMLSVQCSHDVVGVTAAHIHNAQSGVNGPIVFPFADPTSPFTGVMTVTPAEVAQFAAGFFYVNIHSVEFPSGEIRGQIVDNRIFTDGFESGDLAQ